MTQPHGPSPNAPLSFLQVAKFASAFACGIMGGFLYSLKRVNPSLELEFSLGTLFMAVLAGGLALALWNFVSEFAAGLAPGDAAGKARRKLMLLILVSALLVLGMLGSYVYALKDVRRAAFLQVLQGTTLALFVLSGIGVILVRLARLLNKDEPPAGATGIPSLDEKPDEDGHDQA